MDFVKLGDTLMERFDIKGYYINNEKELILYTDYVFDNSFIYIIGTWYDYIYDYLQKCFSNEEYEFEYIDIVENNIGHYGVFRIVMPKNKVKDSWMPILPTSKVIRYEDIGYDPEYDDLKEVVEEYLIDTEGYRPSSFRISDRGGVVKVYNITWSLAKKYY